MIWHGTTELAARRIVAAGHLAAGEHVTRDRRVAAYYAMLAMVEAAPVYELLSSGAKAAVISFDVPAGGLAPDPAPESGEFSQAVLRRGALVRSVEYVDVSASLRARAPEFERSRQVGRLGQFSPVAL